MVGCKLLPSFKISPICLGRFLLVRVNSTYEALWYFFKLMPAKDIVVVYCCVRTVLIDPALHSVERIYLKWEDLGF